MAQRPEIELTRDQKRIVWHLRTVGPTPRTEMAVRLGLHNAAMTRLCRELIALGLLQEAPMTSIAGRGRPVVPLELSSRGGYAAGATVHPGWLEIVLVDFSGKLIAHDMEPFDSPEPRPFIEAVEKRLKGLVMAHNLMRSRFLGLGVAATGATLREDPERRAAVDWLRGWREVKLADYFEGYLGHPVWVENDASLAALAEYYDDRIIRSHSSAIVFFIGHGVGGGLIVDGRMLRGEQGNAGEIGCLYPGDSERPSGIDLLACLQKAGAKIRSLLELEAFTESYSELLAAWIGRAGGQLALAADAGVAWVNPGAIVISGALPLAILEGLAETLRKARWAVAHPQLPMPELHVSRLGSLAVTTGAALLPIHEIAQSDMQ